MDGLTPGRMVHFVCGETHRAAIMVNVSNQEKGLADLFVFSLPQDGRGGFLMATEVEFSEEPRDSTWHWIERA
jgi:hypothetical protein